MRDCKQRTYGKAAIDHQHPPTAWQNLQLSSSWVNYGTGYTTPQCRKFGDLVEVKGVIKKSTALVTNEIIATLPAGYRPSEIMLRPGQVAGLLGCRSS